MGIALVFPGGWPKGELASTWAALSNFWHKTIESLREKNSKSDYLVKLDEKFLVGQFDFDSRKTSQDI